MKARIVSFMSYFLIMLFVYAAVSKLIVFQDFQVQLTQSPLLSAYANLIAYLVILVELVISVLLAAKKTRLVGLYLSYLLMVAFSLYIYLILNYSDFIPCSCGGVLESLSWNEHLWFNIIVCCLTITAAYLLESNYKRFWFAFILTTIIGSGLVIGAFQSSEYIIKKENPFIRRYLPHGVVEDKEIDLQVNTFYFSGSHNNAVYLGNTLSPLRYIVVDSLLNREDYQIQIDSTNFGYRYLKLKTLYPYFFLADGSIPIVFKGRLDNTMQVKSSSIFSFRDAFFSDFIPVDSVAIIIKGQSSLDYKNILGVIENEYNPKVTIVDEVLESTSDGVFESDGTLSFSIKHKKLIYTYYYKSTYIVGDKSLKLTNTQKTIDTTKSIIISSVKLATGENKLATPISPINKKVISKDNLLFILSNSLGLNDSKNIGKQASIIDVYDFLKGNYIGSFYLHHHGDVKVNDIIVTEHYLYALFDTKLVRYKMAKSLRDKFD